MNLTTAHAPDVAPAGTGRLIPQDLPAAPSADLTHTRARVADCAELHRLLQAGCPGAPAQAADTAAMVAICFSGGDASRLVVFSFARAGRPAGCIVGLTEPSQLKARLGPLTLARHGGTRLRIPSDQAVLWDDDVCPFTRALPNIVATLCAPGEPTLMLQSAVGNGPLSQIASTATRAQARLVHTAEEPRERHWAITELGFDGYFATFSSKSRESFRQSQRKLSKAMGGQVRLESFTAVADVERFFAAAESISRQTYQWNELGLGLKNREFVLRRLRAAAELGFLRCHILYCQDKPVAFSEGFAAGGVFLAYQTGYLPELAKLSVGTVQTLEIMKELLGAGGRRWCLDWQSGDGDYKRRISNHSATETTLYLLPRSLRCRVFSACLAMAHAGNHAWQRVNTWRRARLAQVHAPWIGAVTSALQAVDDTTRMNSWF
jgi:hypothetical protein